MESTLRRALIVLVAALLWQTPAFALGDGTGDSGPISASATPANSSHAAGTSVGGKFVLPIVRVTLSSSGPGGSGIITNFFWKSNGGSTGSLVIRVWSKLPSNTTCTDNTAFAGSDTDDVFLITPPFTISPAAPSVTTGDSATYANVQGLTWDYASNDNTPSSNLYVCAVTVSTDTADQNKLVRVTISGTQN